MIEVEDGQDLDGCLEMHHASVFEEKLNGWYTDPSLSPRDRTLQTLKEWCTLELHTVVLDFAESPLEDDGL